MKRIYIVGAALVLAALPVTPVLAGWKLVEHNVATAVAKTALTVTASEDWNRSSTRPIKQSELWTLDGLRLNELYFVAGLLPGESLYKDADKKDHPLPKLSGTAQLSEIPEFFESSNRVALGTSAFQITGVQPSSFSGHDGVKFTYEYSVAGSALPRKGVAVGTVVNHQLYLISFTAPAIFYFDRDQAKAEAIMTSAKF